MMLIPVAVLGATIALGATAIWSLRKTPSPRVGHEPPDGVPVRALCPLLGESVVVHVATSLADPALVVVACERFPGEAPRCDRACFPLDLVRRRPFASEVRA
jgi:hypothetical protein